MAAMQCVACAAPPQAPIPPKAGLRTRPLEEWGAHRHPRRIAGSPWADLLLPVRDRWRNPAVGPMDGCLGQAIVVKLVCRGACREFSDYNFEGPGGFEGWASLRHRTDALRQRPDVKRIGLDRPDAAVRRARTKARNFCRCICAAGRPRLVHHGWGKAVPGFAGSADPPPTQKSRSNRPNPA